MRQRCVRLCILTILKTYTLRAQQLCRQVHKTMHKVDEAMHQILHGVQLHLKRDCNWMQVANVSQDCKAYRAHAVVELLGYNKMKKWLQCETSHYANSTNRFCHLCKYPRASFFLLCLANSKMLWHCNYATVKSVRTLADTCRNSPDAFRRLPQSAHTCRLWQTFATLWK